jgi:hypothetical protein
MEPAEPLWKRVPTRSDDGERLTDFMMIIPGLRSKPEHRIRDTLDRIQLVFDCYHPVVVFAELNLSLNILWVSVRPRPGICLELATALKVKVPEALLVAHKLER